MMDWNHAGSAIGAVLIRQLAHGGRRSATQQALPDDGDSQGWSFSDGPGLWAAENGNMMPTFQGYTDNIIAVAATLHSEHALSGGVDQTVRLWTLP